MVKQKQGSEPQTRQEQELADEVKHWRVMRREAMAWNLVRPMPRYKAQIRAAAGALAVLVADGKTRQGHLAEDRELVRKFSGVAMPTR